MCFPEAPRATKGEKGVCASKNGAYRDKEGEAVELLQELYRMNGGRSDLLLMAYKGYEGRNVWTRCQPTFGLHRGCRWWPGSGRRRECRGVTTDTKGVCVTLGEDTTRLAAMGENPTDDTAGGRWSSGE